MDGFFVAKFKVTKRAKQEKEEDKEKNETVMDEDVPSQDARFDEKEDEEYIQGKFMAVLLGSPQFWLVAHRSFSGQAEAIKGERSPCPGSAPGYGVRYRGPCIGFMHHHPDI